MDDPDAFAALAGVVVYVGLPVAAMLLWWAIGRSQERRHLADLAAREAALEAAKETPEQAQARVEREILELADSVSFR